MQAAQETAAALATAYSALTATLMGHQEQLSQLAAQQQSASEALLSRAQSTVALTRQHLEQSAQAASRCQRAAEGALEQQQTGLNQFGEGFAQSMQQEQVSCSRVWLLAGVLVTTVCMQDSRSRQSFAVTVLERQLRVTSRQGQSQVWEGLLDSQCSCMLKCLGFAPAVQY